MVSTVFLGLDHAFDGGTPLLFETMIFGGEHDEYQERYATWDEAEAGHLVAGMTIIMVLTGIRNGCERFLKPYG